jgi:hypothetical protein
MPTILERVILPPATRPASFRLGLGVNVADQAGVTS